MDKNINIKIIIYNIMKHLKPFNRLNESTHYDELSLTIRDILS